MNMFVKTLALPFLVAPIFVSCMVDDPEDKFDFSSDGQPIANYQMNCHIKFHYIHFR